MARGQITRHNRKGKGQTQAHVGRASGGTTRTRAKNGQVAPNDNNALAAPHTTPGLGAKGAPRAAARAVNAVYLPSLTRSTRKFI